MRIADLRSLTTAAPTRGAARRGLGSGFADLVGDADEAAPTAPASGVMAPSVAGLLALQMVPDATEQRRQGVAQARDLLDDLEALRRALLLGHIPAASLDAMAKRLRHKVDLSGDAKLQDIVGEIELRVAVELAKLGHGVAR
jgi:hypothetical protein